MKTTFIADGNFYLHKSWSISARTRNINHLEKNTLTLFLTSVCGDALALRATYILVVFDSKRSWRHDIFKDYKANRNKGAVEVTTNTGDTVMLEVTAGSLVKKAKMICELAGLPVAQKKGYEGDDLIGCACVSLPGRKDLSVLVNDENLVVQYWPIEKVLLKEKDVIKKFGVQPYQIAEYLALMGDKVDCQPQGTLVTRILPKASRWYTQYLEQTPIEKIKVGDTVLAPNRQGSLVTRKVLATSSRKFKGELLRITTDSGLTSSYTPNHRCMVRTNNFDGGWLVYLMGKNDDSFRIGVTSYTTGGLFSRLRCEGGDKVWLLSVHKNKEDALTHEKYLSWKYSIPDQCFRRKGRSLTSEDTSTYLVKFWSKIGNLLQNAEQILSAFDLDIRYPIQTNPIEYCLYGDRLSPMFAANLRVGMSVVSIKGKKKTFERVVKIERIPYNGKVHSLEIDGEHTYIADSILTHNCIPGIPGVAHGTASKWLTKHGTIKAMLKDEKILAKIKPHKAQLEMARKLTTLKCDVVFKLEDMVPQPMDHDLSEHVWQIPKALKELGDARVFAAKKGLFGKR
jgi:5'-3' exonuclease